MFRQRLTRLQRKPSSVGKPEPALSTYMQKNHTGNPHPDPNPVLGAYVEKIHRETNLICNVTTGGGRQATDEELDKMIEQRCILGQEMMLINLGTINLWTPPYKGVFMNQTPRIKR
ncbi:hypothetical protein GF326_02815 [Candidatus Bathyarchaeota archaeon]|nr:hypothetical protein [Candidatus Bathyarchaeota archaeon]